MSGDFNWGFSSHQPIEAKCWDQFYSEFENAFKDNEKTTYMRPAHLHSSFFIK